MMMTSWSNCLLFLSTIFLFLIEPPSTEAFAVSSVVSSARYRHTTANNRRHQQSTPISSSSSSGRGKITTQVFSTGTTAGQETMSSITITSTISGPTLPKLASNAKRLFLVRHGEVINPGGDRPVYYGAMDIPLSALGQAEARAAADYLAQYQLAKVFSSPLQRAIYGAQQILQRQQSSSTSSLSDNDDKDKGDVIIIDGFKELERGAWCGLTKEEIGAENLVRFDACDESITPTGGESYSFLKSRVLTALGTNNDINDSNNSKSKSSVLSMMQPGEAAAIVSHLQVTRSILSQALNIPTSEMVAKLPIATASVTCVDYCAKEGEESDGNGDNDDYIITVHYQSFKPDSGLEKAKDGAN
jgi:broad specificity phosphatase PhoE